MLNYNRGIEKVKEVVPGLNHLIYSDDRALGLAMVRFAEHYESPNPDFQGQTFSFQEYVNWYVKNSDGGKKTGKFTYYEDWPGFNFPGENLTKFYEGKFNPLRVSEKEVLDFFVDKHKKSERFYIIATSDGASKELDNHEIAHGLFYLSQEYKEKALEILAHGKRDGLKPLENFIMGDCGAVGYAKNVLLDELQAYIVDGEDIICENLTSSALTQMASELRPLFFETLDKLKR